MMKYILSAIFFTTFAIPGIRAEEISAAGPKVELNQIVGEINKKLQGGVRRVEALESELATFEALYEKYQSQKTDAVAEILYMQAMLYLQVFQDFEKGLKILDKLKMDLPDTKFGKRAEGIIQQVKVQAEAQKISESLKIGAKFPDFDEKDLKGESLSLGRFKGKPVLIDFWATWCGPCVNELPSVIEAYDEYHEKGFDIVGINMDQDKDKLKGFLESRDMPWPQYFDGLGWGNKLAQKYGVKSIPATFLLDGDGIIVAKSLRGDQLKEALSKLLD